MVVTRLVHWVNFTVYNTDLNKSGLEISNKGQGGGGQRQGRPGGRAEGLWNQA